jgi:hypothetical protein
VEQAHWPTVQVASGVKVVVSGPRIVRADGEMKAVMVSKKYASNAVVMKIVEKDETMV